MRLVVVLLDINAESRDNLQSQARGKDGGVAAESMIVRAGKARLFDNERMPRIAKSDRPQTRRGNFVHQPFLSSRAMLTVSLSFGFVLRVCHRAGRDSRRRRGAKGADGGGCRPRGNFTRAGVVVGGPPVWVVVASVSVERPRMTAARFLEFFKLLAFLRAISDVTLPHREEPRERSIGFPS